MCALHNTYLMLQFETMVMVLKFRAKVAPFVLGQQYRLYEVVHYYKTMAVVEDYYSESRLPFRRHGVDYRLRVGY